MLTQECLQCIIMVKRFVSDYVYMGVMLTEECLQCIIMVKRFVSDYVYMGVMLTEECLQCIKMVRQYYIATSPKPYPNPNTNLWLYSNLNFCRNILRSAQYSGIKSYRL